MVGASFSALTRRPRRTPLGADLYFQGGVLAPGWNAAGAVLSNAGHARIGVL